MSEQKPYSLKEVEYLVKHKGPVPFRMAVQLLETMKRERRFLAALRYLSDHQIEGSV